jgi:HEAT repeat protein
LSDIEQPLLQKSIEDSRAIDAFIAVLKDGDFVVRCGAADALAEIQDPRAADALIAAQKDAEPLLRTQVTAALARLNVSRGGKSTTAAVEEDKPVRRLGADVLKIKDPRKNNFFADESFFKNNAPLKQRLIEWEQAAPEQVIGQVKILRSGDASSRADAAIQLRKAGSSAQGAILALLETLYDPRVDKLVYVDSAVPRAMIGVSPAAEAAETLAGMGEPAVEPLVAVLKNGDAFRESSRSH